MSQAQRTVMAAASQAPHPLHRDRPRWASAITGASSTSEYQGLAPLNSPPVSAKLAQVSYAIAQENNKTAESSTHSAGCTSFLRKKHAVTETNRNASATFNVPREKLVKE